MANITPVFRQRTLLAFLKRRPYASFTEIKERVCYKLEEQYLRDDRTNTGFSKRTFERDVKDIAALYGAEIVYSKKERGYFLETDVNSSALEQMLTGFDLLNAFKLTKNIAPHVFLEDRKPMGTQHLFGLLHAIQEKLVVEFTHQKFWEEHSTQRTVYPIAVKEFRYRWYLVAEDQKDHRVKTFGLDRISDLQISANHFSRKDYSAVLEKFKHAFGVIASDEEKPTEVILSFTPFQGKYVKSLPLHHSQKVLIDNPQETRISLLIYPTHDFIMELLSFGKEVTIEEPKWLKQQVVQKHQEAIEINS
jgi:predicted DNA-binding transcriptional regulator YafY